MPFSASNDAPVKVGRSGLQKAGGCSKVHLYTMPILDVHARRLRLRTYLCWKRQIRTYNNIHICQS